MRSSKIGSTIKDFFGLPIACYAGLNEFQAQESSLMSPPIPKTKSVPVVIENHKSKGSDKPQTIKTETEKNIKKRFGELPHEVSKLFPLEPFFQFSTSSIETDKYQMGARPIAERSSCESLEALRVFQEKLKLALQGFKIDQICLFYKNLREVYEALENKSSFEGIQIEEKTENDCLEAISILEDFFSISLLQVSNEE